MSIILETNNHFARIKLKTHFFFGNILGLCSNELLVQEITESDNNKNTINNKNPKIHKKISNCDQENYQ